MRQKAHSRLSWREIDQRMKTRGAMILDSVSVLSYGSAAAQLALLKMKRTIQTTVRQDGMPVSFWRNLDGV
jgi:hypothetical protein